MRGISSQLLKDGNYNVEDVMKSIFAHQKAGREMQFHEICLYSYL
jgi:hypothetical protein